MYTMMNLGGFKFSVSSATFDTLKRKYSWEWEEKKLVKEQAPRLEYRGPLVEEIELEGLILPHHITAQSAKHIETLRQLAGTGQPMELADARGNIWGQYCITSLSEEQSVFHKSGAPRVISFSISLQKQTKATAPT